MVEMRLVLAQNAPSSSPLSLLQVPRRGARRPPLLVAANELLCTCTFCRHQRRPVHAGRQQPRGGGVWAAESVPRHWLLQGRQLLLLLWLVQGLVQRMQGVQVSAVSGWECGGSCCVFMIC